MQCKIARASIPKSISEIVGFVAFCWPWSPVRRYSPTLRSAMVVRLPGSKVKVESIQQLRAIQIFLCIGFIVRLFRGQDLARSGAPISRDAEDVLSRYAALDRAGEQSIWDNLCIKSGRSQSIGHLSLSALVLPDGSARLWMYRIECDLSAHCALSSRNQRVKKAWSISSLQITTGQSFRLGKSYALTP